MLACGKKAGAYEIDVKWCDEEGIHNPADLAGRIISHKDYERL